MLTTPLRDRAAQPSASSTPGKPDEGWLRAAIPAQGDSGEHGVLPRLIQRARAEFTEMPGLRLTVAQAARLWALDTGTSAAMLAALVGTGFLMKQGERYSRAGGT